MPERYGSLYRCRKSSLPYYQLCHHSHHLSVWRVTYRWTWTALDHSKFGSTVLSMDQSRKLGTVQDAVTMTDQSAANAV